MRLSMPKATRATLPLRIPEPRAMKASTTFQAVVAHSRSRALRCKRG
jgi:hypothetical protein